MHRLPDRYLWRMLSVPIKFGVRSDFRKELHKKVYEYLDNCGKPIRAPLAMYRKTAILLAWLALAYTALVFISSSWWQALLSSALMAAAIAGIGFNIPHDAGHGSYSGNAAVNRGMAFVFDIMGASSYCWHWKHNVLHHGWTNVPGVDDDINVGPLARLAPQQKHYGFHRLQQYYLWGLYGLTTLKWQLVDDFKDIILGRIGPRQIPRPKGMELVLFFVGKATWATIFLVIPLMFHSFGTVLTMYLVTNAILGVITSVVFQMAHTVEEADFVPPPPGAPEERIQNEWAAHQAETTVNFAPRNRFWTWYLGGLNYQIEHHLFPSVSHQHYPDIAPIVEQTCRAHNVGYYTHPSFRAAIASHFRYLREMGKPPEMAPA